VAAGPVSRILSAEDQQDGHSSGPHITARLKRPTRRFSAPSRHASRRFRKSFRQLSGPTEPAGTSSLFGLAPCGVCPARRITAAAVRSYRTFSPLPRRFRRFRCVKPAKPAEPARRYVFCGTFRRTSLNSPSRTLSGTPLCGVRTFLCHPLWATATVRSSCQLHHYIGCCQPEPKPFCRSASPVWGLLNLSGTIARLLLLADQVFS
jgi:hypothetical protein